MRETALEMCRADREMYSSRSVLQARANLLSVGADKGVHMCLAVGYDVDSRLSAVLSRNCEKKNIYEEYVVFIALF